MSAKEVVTRLHAAMNAHDIDAFVSLFDPDYDSRQPVHPDRAFRGRDPIVAPLLKQRGLEGDSQVK